MTQDIPAPIGKLLAALDGPELLFNYSWDEWLAVTPPYASVAFTQKDVITRYNHSRLYAMAVFQLSQQLAQGAVPDGQPD